MTDTATIEALLERLESHMGKQSRDILLADCRQAASTIRALSAENEWMRTGLDAIVIGEGLPEVIAQQALQEQSNDTE